MLRHIRRHKKGYLFAIAAIAAVTLVRAMTAYLFATDTPLLLSVVAVFAAAWYRGFAPGVLATLLSILGTVSLHFGAASLPPEIIRAPLRLVMFFLVGIVISVVGEVTVRHRRQLQAKQRRLVVALERHKASEQRLDRLYAQLRLVTDHASVYIAHLDTQHRFKFVNKPYAEHFGATPEELVGRRVAEVLEPEAYERLKPYMDRAARGESVHHETELSFRELGKRHVHISYQPERDGEGHVNGYVAAITDHTERKRIEDELRLNQERLDIAQQAADVGLFEWNMSTGKSIWTPALEALYGFSPGEYDGSFEGWKQRVHPHDWKNVEAALDQAMNALKNPIGEFRVVRPDGEVRWIASRGRVFADDHGKATRMIGVNVDITDRKLTERTLRRRERMLAQSQQLAHVGGWELDLDDLDYLPNNVLRWTDETYRIFGFEPGGVEVSNELFLNLVHADDRVSVLQEIMDALRKNVPYEMEHRIVRGDGVERTLHQWGTFVYNADGRPVRIIGTVQDITERRHMEEALRASEQRFRLLADAMPQMAWTTDAQGRVTYVNQRWLDYTGLTLPMSQMSTGLKSVVHPEDQAFMLQTWKRCVATGDDYEFQMRFKRASDGAFRWFLSRGVAVRNRQGVTLQWFGTATDIEDQKQMEEALREADRRKDEFLATLAHELRNPLAPIRHGLQLMRMPAANEALRENAQSMMERQTNQMARLIDDLLDISRISRGTLDLRKEWISLGAAVQSAVEASTPVVEAAGHQLCLDISADATLLNADLTRLAQVFSNLLNNAAKYTPPGGRIDLVAKRGDGEVVVTIKDTGIGIPPEKLSTVFDMFVQLDRSLEAARGGLGIGLTLAKRLVEMHGGRLEAYSKGSGMGASFVVRLPVVVLPTERPSQPMTAESNEPTANGTSILVVDDNYDSAESLSAVLACMGFRTLTAHDGIEALEKAEAHRPDVVLLDIGMPRLNGYETARRLRETVWGQQALLIALTGWGQDGDKRRAAEAGFDYHFTKPLEPALLTKLLAEQRRHGAATLQ